MITSTANERVKLARLLNTQAKARREENRMVLEGVRLVRDALLHGQTPDFILYDPDSISLESLEVEARRALPLLAASFDVIRHVSDTETPSGVVGVFPIAPPPAPDKPQRALILDGLRDPGNVGTILRTAGAAGVDVVLLAPGSTDAYNPKTLRAGMGAHFRVPVLEASWTRIALYCQNARIYLADMMGDIAYTEADWTPSWALIIGSEAHGESQQAAQLAQQRVYIPMAAETESLNAAIAAGILLFEAARKSG